MSLQLPDGSPVYDSSSPNVQSVTYKSSPGRLGGIVGVVLVFVIGNILLVGGQKIWHHNDQNKLENIKQELLTRKITINDLEAKLTTDRSRIEGYSDDVDVETYNFQVDSYNSMLNRYKVDIDSYNKLVDEANNLSKKIGGTWYIVPIPVGRTESK